MNNVKGFTGIELMIAVAIFSILVVVAGTVFTPMIDHYRLNQGTRELMSALRSEAQIAISRNTDRTVTFSPGVDRYTVGGGTPETRDLPSGISYGVSGTGAPANGTPDVGGAGIPSDGITFSGNDVVFQNNRVPDEAGEIYLTNSRGENIAVSVNLVGRIRCWRWGGASWQNC